MSAPAAVAAAVPPSHPVELLCTVVDPSAFIPIVTLAWPSNRIVRCDTITLVTEEAQRQAFVNHLRAVTASGKRTSVLVSSNWSLSLADWFCQHSKLAACPAVPIHVGRRLLESADNTHFETPLAAPRDLNREEKECAEIALLYLIKKSRTYDYIHRRALRRRAQKNRLQAAISEHWPSRYYFAGVATLVADFLDSWPVTSRLL